MTNILVQRLIERVNRDESDSDFSYFFSLLCAGEALTKFVTATIVAGIEVDRERHQYRLEHGLVRSSGIGDWSAALDDALTGTASQFLRSEARLDQKILTEVCRDPDWRYRAVHLLKTAMEKLEIDSEDLPSKCDLRRWFRLFAVLRNKTRGHGATTSTKASECIQHLRQSLECILGNLSLLNRDCAFLYRNLSGKYRVSVLSGEGSAYEPLRKEACHTFTNGVYVYYDKPCRINLLQSDPELSDFFFPNGGLTNKKYELISYVTDNRIDGDATAYILPPGRLPASETEGHYELSARGRVFTNAPQTLSDYIERPALEEELSRLLLDDRHPVITLVGRGGIGKTSLALRVLESLTSAERFDVVVWLSARDLDLLDSGPKPVQARVLSQEDIAKCYAELLRPAEELAQKGFNSTLFAERQLEQSEIGPTLFVLDNFETTRDPIDLYNWLECHVRLPNKILITTRLRDFKGDYPIEVGGMKPSESRQLLYQMAGKLGIRNLITSEFITDVIEESQGHPYIIKIWLGTIAQEKKLRSLSPLMASSDEILTALFERTYATLTPCAQRVFMTLASWNSLVPRIALEAVLLRSTGVRQEVERAVQTLVQFSMAEIHASKDDHQEFIGIPLAASFFGKKKLNVSPLKTAIQSDTHILQMFAPSRSGDTRGGLAKKLVEFVSAISRSDKQDSDAAVYSELLEMMCRTYPDGWLILGRWHEESGRTANAIKAYEYYLESCPTGKGAARAWQALSILRYRESDVFGSIHAEIERAQLDGVPFSELSITANRLNQLLKDQVLAVEREERKVLATRLLSALARRQSEANASDLSRMAWLALNIGDEDSAFKYASVGSELDPNNPHCYKLLERIKNKTRY